MWIRLGSPIVFRGLSDGGEGAAAELAEGGGDDFAIGFEGNDFGEAFVEVARGLEMGEDGGDFALEALLDDVDVAQADEEAGGGAGQRVQGGAEAGEELAGGDLELGGDEESAIGAGHLALELLTEELLAAALPVGGAAAGEVAGLLVFIGPGELVLDHGSGPGGDIVPAVGARGGELALQIGAGAPVLETFAGDAEGLGEVVPGGGEGAGERRGRLCRRLDLGAGEERALGGGEGAAAVQAAD